MHFETQTAIPSLRKRPFQFSVKTLLIVMTLTGLALANPGFAVIAPFAVGISIITVALILLVAAVSLVVAVDRRLVLNWAWRNLWPILLVNAWLVAYLFYAMQIIQWVD